MRNPYLGPEPETAKNLAVILTTALISIVLIY